MRQNSLFVRGVAVCFFLGLLAAFAFAQDEKITEGSLRVIDKTGKELGLCPLKNTQVSAEIDGFLARVTVTQIFQNPFNEPIEAVYTFPLPNDAAVDEMTITIGERLVKGRIMERKQARTLYEQAKQEGKIAALLAQQRPNIFTQAVANIMPAAEIKVVISYVETLRYADDAYEFRFPMTVGERYIPSSVEAEDAAKISPELKARPGHTISLELKIEAGVSVENLASNTHEIETRQFSASRFTVKLKNEAEIPNRDFVLRYKTAGVGIEDAILAHKDERGGFFTLILQPPDKILPPDTMPKEIVFVLDTSYSMSGFPIEKAKEAMRLTLDNLNPQDTFNLITFAGETRILFDQPVPATKENLARARKLLNDVKSYGGTEMMKAIKAALDPSDSQQHVRVVCFMTDGQVGNDAEIIGEVRKHANARVFAFGIGNSVNHYLLDEISREGRGEVEYVSTTDDGSAAARRFYERIRNPLLTDVSLEFQGVRTTEMFPQEIPDLFDAKPVAVVGRYAQGGRGTIVLRGKMRGQTFAREIAVELPEQNSGNEVLATLWARQKIAGLMRQNSSLTEKSERKDALERAITNLGLEFRLLTPFTSFVAVDERTVTDGTQTRRVEVPAASVENLPVSFSAEYGQAGGAQTSVTVVSSSSAMVGATETRATTTITTRVTEASLDRGNSAQSLFSIPAGVTQIGESRTRVQQGLISVTGQRPTSNYFTVDGLSVNTGAAADETSVSGSIGTLPDLTASGGTNSLSLLDATAEIYLRTMATASEGRVAGASIDFRSKSGTDNFRGSLFETFGNEAFNANDFFANSRGLKRSAARLNQFGGTLGGFLLRNHVWFFGSYEGLRLRQAAFSVSEVPSLSSRQNAASGVRPLFDAFPLPNGRATTNGFAEFAAVFTNPAAHDVFGLRLDVQPNSALRFFGSYNFADSKASRRGSGDFSLNTQRRLDTRRSALSLSSAYILSPSVLIYGRASFSRSRLAQNFTPDNFGGASVPASIAAANFDFLKYDLTGKNSALAIGKSIDTRVNQFQVNGSLMLRQGNHAAAFGADFRRLKFDLGASPVERSVLFSGVNLSGTAARIDQLARVQGQSSALENFSLFAHDEWEIGQKLKLNFGLRWDMDFAPKTNAANVSFQNAAPEIRDNFKNFAPRLSFAFNPLESGKIAIRGGVGLYYDFGNELLSGIFADSFPFAGGNYARNVDFNAAPNLALKPLLAFDAKLQTPRTWKFLGEYQQEIFADNVLTVSYMGALGRRLFLTRTLLNRDPNFNFIRLTGNDAESDYHALNFVYEKRFAQRFSLTSRYTLAKSIDNFSTDTFRQNAFVSDDLNDERGASDFDVRHQFSLSGVYEAQTPFKTGALNFLTRNWMISGILNARTAFPLNVVYARMNDFGVELLRPDLVAGVPLYTEAGGRKQINAAAFSIPNADRQGNLARNALRGFRFFQLDLGLQRHFRFSTESNLRLTMQVFNVLNNTNFADTNGNLGTQASGGNFVPDNYFGQTTSVFGGNSFTSFYLYGGARTIQFSARFVF